MLPALGDGHAPCVGVRRSGRAERGFNTVGRPPAAKERGDHCRVSITESDLAGTMIRYSPEKTLFDGRGGPNGRCPQQFFGPRDSR